MLAPGLQCFWDIARKNLNRGRNFLLPALKELVSANSWELCDIKLTSDEAKKVIALYFENNESPSTTFRRFNTWAHQNQSPTRITKKNVVDTMRRFRKTAILTKDAWQKQSLTKHDATIMGVLGSLGQQRGKSIRSKWHFFQRGRTGWRPHSRFQSASWAQNGRCEERCSCSASEDAGMHRFGGPSTPASLNVNSKWFCSCCSDIFSCSLWQRYFHCAGMLFPETSICHLKNSRLISISVFI